MIRIKNVVAFFIYISIFGWGVTDCSADEKRSITRTVNSKLDVEKIRQQYLIPELNYAVISSTDTLEIHALGFKKSGTLKKATLSDRFRIGSNTKTVTSYIASNLIQQGVINWHTRFFDLYPELTTISNSAYHNLPLIDLLSFRAPLQS